MAAKSLEGTLQKNLEYFSCVWVDREVNTSADNLKLQKKIRACIDHLRTFDNEEDCIEQIRAGRTQKILLIVSGRAGSVIIPLIHHLTQLAAFYVFCVNQQWNEEWSCKYSKSQGVFVQPKLLLKKLREDYIQRCRIEDGLSIAILPNSEQTRDERNVDYLWFQLYIEVLIRMHHQKADRKEFVDICRSACQSDSQRQLIDEFEEHYRSDEALKWYTREGCFYRIINQALRAQDFDVLFAGRAFITDIAKQIQTEYETFIRTTVNRDPFRVYRGQILDQHEFEWIQRSINEYLSMNSFLSTSRKRETAIRFARSIAPTSFTKRGLFEIDIDPRLNSKPFADITALSFYRREAEVLIMIGALFRVIQVEHDQTEDLWIIKLALVNEDSYSLRDTLVNRRNKIGEETNLASLGKVLFEMGRNDQVEKCYQKMMHNAQLDVSAAYAGLGKAASGREDFAKALEYEKKALEIKQQWLSSNDPALAISFSRIGDLYRSLGDTERSLRYLRDARKLQEKDPKSDYSELAKTYQRLSLLYDELDYHDRAIELCQKVLTIHIQILPTYSPRLAKTYHDLGVLYYNNARFAEASECYDKASEIYRKTLPNNHRKVIKLQEDMKKTRIASSET